jgi:hypothetical protein
MSKALTSVAASVALLWACTVKGQTVQGKAEVRAIKGNATAAVAGGPATPLKVGTALPPGSTIKTDSGSVVDLFLGNSAGVVRVTENTTLSIDKLNITETGADNVVELLMNLPDGTILGNVNKLSAASKYEIKLPNGVAGVRGTRYRCSSTMLFVLLEGTSIMVLAMPGVAPTPYTMVAPPPVFFSPLEGVKPLPPEVFQEVQQQFGPQGPGLPELTVPPGTGEPRVFVESETGSSPNRPN